jgi:putative ABC transport system permease protein
MIGVALRGLAGRKLRAALTAFAIVLGVSMVSGTYVLTDTIDKAFSNLFSQTYADTDVRITGKSADISVEGEDAAAPAVPDAVLEQVRALPSVAVAAGTIADEQTKLLDKDGEAIAPDAPTFAFGVDFRAELERFNPTELVEGRWPSGPDQVAIDARTADGEGYRIGDTIGVAVDGPVEELEIAGIARYGGVDSIGNATFAILDVTTAQALLDKRGELDEILVAAEQGVSSERLARELEASLPASIEVRTGAESARDETEEVTAFTDYIRYFLLAFAGIALFVGAFVIFNTLSITVAQRTRELATLRTIGASRRQVLGSVVVEALAIGCVSAVLGLGLGLVLAYGLKALFAALGAALPEVGMVIAPRTVLVSMLIGVGVTLLAGLVPALGRPACRPSRPSARGPSCRSRGSRSWCRTPAEPRSRSRSRSSATRCSPPAWERRSGCCRSRPGASASSSASRCSPRVSYARSRPCSAGRRGGWGARPASSPRGTPAATQAARPRPPPH